MAKEGLTDAEFRKQFEKDIQKSIFGKGNAKRNKARAEIKQTAIDTKARSTKTGRFGGKSSISRGGGGFGVALSQGRVKATKTRPGGR